MAGITLQSDAVTLGAGSTSADNDVSGLVQGQQILLGVTGTPSSTTWGLAKPSDATARSDLSSATAAAPTFTPDKGGIYLVSCNADGTVYTLRITVNAVGSVTTRDSIRFVPTAAAAVPVPPTGSKTMFLDSADSALKLKDSADSLETVTTT